MDRQTKELLYLEVLRGVTIVMHLPSTYSAMLQKYKIAH